MRNIIVGLLLFCFCVEVKKKRIVNAFKNKQLINAQTVVIPEGFDFMIMHRFGKIGLVDRIYKDFLGFDTSAIIRFLYRTSSATEHIGVGRTKIGKTIDVEGKYVLLRQTTDNSTPISLAVFNNTGINTEPYNDYGPNAFFSDSITPFNNRFAHRLNYTTELIISKKFNDKLSLQLNPLYLKISY